MTGPKRGMPQGEEDKKGDTPLPMFRKDLQLLKGPDEPDGSPTYNLYDPVRSKYYRLMWYEAAILEILKPGTTLKQLARRLSAHTSVEVTIHDLEMFFYDAKMHNLLDIDRTSEDIHEEAESKEVNPLVWALFHYLYIRIPLFHPDHFLEKTLRYVTPLASRKAMIVYLFFIVTGLFMLMNRFETFINTFTYFFNWKGIFAYAVAVICTKVFHELGHAYTAKYYGLHVPVMGIAFIIMWPVMYTDASDVWKLQNRRQRFAISVGGIVVELVIAGIATWGWFFSGPGIMKSVWFLLASVSWISSLLINLNPCMRFDGYYILSDIWGVDNLQTRAFAITRWKLREWLLGLNAPPPEQVSRRRMVGMVVYSIATWIYRLFLYIGIAVIIYYKFTKILGIILFAISLVMFIVWPLVSELQSVFKLKNLVRLNVRLAVTVLAATVALIWFVFPMPQTLYFPAITIPSQNQNIYIPRDGKIVKLFVEKGDSVKKRQPLLEITSETLNAEMRSTVLDMETVKKELLKATIIEKERSTLAPKQAELRALYSKLKALEEQKKTLTIRAALDGTIYDWDDNLKVGQSLSKDMLIGRIAQLDKIKVIAYVSEDDIGNIKLGEQVRFKISSSFKEFAGKVDNIRTGRDITLEHSQLSSVFGGDLPTKRGKDEGELQLIESYYVVDVDLSNSSENIAIGRLGYVEVSGYWRSRLMNVVRLIQRVFYRESGV